MRTRLALILLLLCTPALAQLTWEKQTITVAGTPDTGHLDAVFKFKNSGNYPVRLLSVKPSCGCTTASVTKMDYAPGESGEIPARLKITWGKAQPSGITVTTDDPKQPKTILVLNPQIQDAAEIRPTFLFWKAGEEMVPKSISLTMPEAFPVRSVEVSSSDPAMNARVETLQPGREYRVVVTPKAGSKKLKAVLTITGKYEKGEPKAFTAHARVY